MEALKFSAMSQMSLASLSEQVVLRRKNLMTLRFQKKIDEKSVKTHVIRQMKKEIAQLKTASSLVRKGGN